MRHFLDSSTRTTPNADGHMTEEQKNEYLKKYEAELITPAEVALWKRGASNAGYHYLGCAKTFALMGKAFAEANLKMLELGAADGSSQWCVHEDNHPISIGFTAGRSCRRLHRRKFSKAKWPATALWPGRNLPAAPAVLLASAGVPSRRPE